MRSYNSSRYQEDEDASLESYVPLAEQPSQAKLKAKNRVQKPNTPQEWQMLQFV